jgi:hypothetical protein
MDIDMKKSMILAALAPLFEKARARGLWFHNVSQGLWFSPDELSAAHKEERFIWGAENWRLCDPNERLEQLNNVIAAAEAEKARFVARMQKKAAPGMKG